MATATCLLEAPVLDRHAGGPDLDPDRDPFGDPEPERRPVPAPGANRGGMRRIGRWLVIVSSLYLGGLGVLYAMQTRLIFPGAETQGKPSSVVKPTPGTQLVPLTTESGDKIVALFGPALQPDGNVLPVGEAEARPTLLYFYGNAMCLNDAMFEFDHFRRLGVNMMIPEFVGYGMSEGKPSEAGCRETADAAFAHLQHRTDLNPRKIVAAGWSLGGAVAVDLASRKPVAGLIAFCAFTSMGDMSRRHFPFVPSSLLLRHRFDSQSKLRSVACPILLGHGRHDEIVPIEMQERLAAAATKAPVMKFIVEDAGHNDFYAAGEDKIFQAMVHFLESLSEPR
jgi:fermentation-respiration switch protein FrsA (DUF1100 family)